VRSDGRSSIPTRHSMEDRCDPERRSQVSEARNRRARTADHIYEFCRLCDNPVTAYYTVTGLNRHCVTKHGYTFRAAGHRYVPIAEEDLGQRQDRVRAAQRPRRRRRRGDPTDKVCDQVPSTSQCHSGVSREAAANRSREPSGGQSSYRAARIAVSAASRVRDWSPAVDRRSARHEPCQRRVSPSPDRRRTSRSGREPSPSLSGSGSSSSARSSPVPSRATDQIRPVPADLDDMSSEVSCLELATDVEAELMQDWSASGLAACDLDEEFGTSVNPATSAYGRPENETADASASVRSSPGDSEAPPPGFVTAPATGRNGELPAPGPVSSGSPSASPPAVVLSSEDEPEQLGEPRPSPTLTFRDVLAATRLAQPTDINVIVDQLQRTFRVPYTLRELALVITGMFVGRAGLARELRDAVITGNMVGTADGVIIATILARLDGLVNSLPEDLSS